MSNSLIFDENKHIFKSICEELSQGPNLSTYFYKEVKQSNENRYSQFVEKKLNDSIKREIENDKGQDAPTRLELSDLQAKILSSNGSDRSCFSEVESLDPKMILSDGSLVVSDDVLQDVLERLPSIDSSSAYLYAKMVILPKLNNNGGEVSSMTGDLLREAFIVHEQELADGALCPLLSSPGKTSSHVIHHLITQEVHLITINNLIRSLSKKDCPDETDLDTFSFLFDHLQPNDQDSQQATMEFLERYSVQFSKSVKFGRCVLKSIQKMSEHLGSRENLNMIVGFHKSSMKKTLEIHLRKLK